MVDSAAVHVPDASVSAVGLPTHPVLVAFWQSPPGACWICSALYPALAGSLPGVMQLIRETSAAVPIVPLELSDWHDAEMVGGVEATFRAYVSGPFGIDLPAALAAVTCSKYFPAADVSNAGLAVLSPTMAGFGACENVDWNASANRLDDRSTRAPPASRLN